MPHPDDETTAARLRRLELALEYYATGRHDGGRLAEATLRPSRPARVAPPAPAGRPPASRAAAGQTATYSRPLKNTQAALKGESK